MLVLPDSFGTENFEVYLKEVFSGTLYPDRLLNSAFDGEIYFSFL